MWNKRFYSYNLKKKKTLHLFFLKNFYANRVGFLLIRKIKIFELYYVKVIKKVFKKKKYHKRGSRMFKIWYWLNIRINQHFRHKNKNSRMGKGTGLIFKSAYVGSINSLFLLTNHFNKLSRISRKLKDKFNLKFLINCLSLTQLLE